MFDSTLIFQRTHTGRTEIHEKKKGLTQSERLVLIMVDGASTFGGVRAKLPVLSDERFERAIRTLQQKELISEVFMPLEGQAAEEVERTVIDRFLQQDPLDPVTIIMFEDDERLELVSQTNAARSMPELQSPIHASQAPRVSAAMAMSAGAHVQIDGPTISDRREAEDEVAFAAENPYLATGPMPEAPPQSDPISDWLTKEPASPARRYTGSLETATMFYWGLTVAGAFVLGFAVARMTG